MAAVLNIAQQQQLMDYKDVIFNWLGIFENDLNPTQPVHEMIARLHFVLPLFEHCATESQLAECRFVFHEIDNQARECFLLPAKISAGHRCR